MVVPRPVNCRCTDSDVGGVGSSEEKDVEEGSEAWVSGPAGDERSGPGAVAPETATVGIVSSLTSVEHSIVVVSLQPPLPVTVLPLLAMRNGPPAPLRADEATLVFVRRGANHCRKENRGGFGCRPVVVEVEDEEDAGSWVSETLEAVVTLSQLCWTLWSPSLNSGGCDDKTVWRDVEDDEAAAPRNTSRLIDTTATVW